MDTQIVKVKCDKNLGLLLPILKNRIDNPESSSESYGTSSNSSDSESFDTEIYNFDKELDNEDIIFLLNIIGQTYLSEKGFCNNDLVQFSDKMNKNLINSFIEQSKEEDYYINKSNGKFNIELDFFIEKSIITIPYTKVIIKYNKYFSVLCEHNHKWLEIDDENNQIIISRENKKLTIDDILYATRPISVTYGRGEIFMVEIDKQEFELLDDKDNVLTLKY